MEFAEVTWSFSDIKELRPDWGDNKCEDFLRDYQNIIRDRLTEYGWEVIEELLD